MSALALVKTDSLRELAAEINTHVADAESAARSALAAALAAGELLNRAKSMVPHGEWESWITSNTKLAPRTARAYASLAARMPLLPEPERQRVAELPVREAVRAIAMGPMTTTRRHPPPRFDAPVLKRAFTIMNRCTTLTGRGASRDRITAIRGDLVELIAELDKMLNRGGG